MNHTNNTDIEQAWNELKNRHFRYGEPSSWKAFDKDVLALITQEKKALLTELLEELLLCQVPVAFIPHNNRPIFDRLSEAEDRFFVGADQITQTLEAKLREMDK